MSEHKIDMKAIAKSGIDCEFWDYGLIAISKLVCYQTIVPEEHEQYHCENGLIFPKCRPRLNHKHVLDDYSVLPDGLVVRVRFQKNVSHGLLLMREELIKSEELAKVARLNLVWFIEILGTHAPYKHEGLEVIEL